MDERIAELKRMPYEEYLNTPEWGQKRAQALARAQYRCQVCNSPDGLQVHHRTYENKGDEEPEDLTVLCEKCHSLYHSSYDTGVKARPVLDILNDYYDQVEYQQQNPDEVFGFPTGLSDLDKLLGGGLQCSDMVVLSSRPGHGKTSLALSIALQAARRWAKRVAIFSLEMSDEQLVQRLISAEIGIDTTRLRSGEIKADEWSMFHQAIKLISETSIFIDDTPAISSLHLRAAARRLQEEVGLDLLIVDYLQLIGRGTRYQSREQELGFNSRVLKTLARELDIPVLVLSQLSRKVESRHNKRPVLSDLLDQGSLDQEADVVIFIYRDEVYNLDTEFPNIAEINVAKHRSGATGTFSLYFKKQMAQFVELEIRSQPLEDF